jgi:hypothetical protein
VLSQIKLIFEGAADDLCDYWHQPTGHFAHVGRGHIGGAASIESTISISERCSGDRPIAAHTLAFVRFGLGSSISPVAIRMTWNRVADDIGGALLAFRSFRHQGSSTTCLAASNISSAVPVTRSASHPLKAMA